MATFNRLPSGFWRAQVRRKHQYVSRSFRLKSDAQAWAIEMEDAVRVGKSLKAVKITSGTTFTNLVDLHITDLAEVRKPLLRSKAMCLEKLKANLGSEALSNLTRERLIDFGKMRAREGAGPVTLGIDLGYIRTILVHAAAVHGVEVPTEQITLARVALTRLGRPANPDVSFLRHDKHSTRAPSR